MVFFSFLGGGIGDRLRVGGVRGEGVRGVGVVGIDGVMRGGVDWDLDGWSLLVRWRGWGAC